MPKKKKASKNSKNSFINEKRKLLEADIDGQTYGVIERALGSAFFDVYCMDGKIRRCKARSKRMKVKIGDCLIVSLREFDDKNADIIHRYDSEEVRTLQKLGLLPNSDKFSGIVNENINNDDNTDDIFCFDDI